MLTFRRLGTPKFLVGSGALVHSVLGGLRSNGPYSQGDCPRDPKILFVFPEELKDRANQLFIALRNGIGPFRGTESLLRFKMTSTNVSRLPEFSIANIFDHESADVYSREIRSYLRSLNSKPDIAVIIHRKTERTDQNNPYLTSKFALLNVGIPSQIVTEDLLSTPETFQWSVANIALAMFSKLGGQPWAVQSDLSDDTLVVGIGRAILGTSRYYGFASAFGHNGVFLGTTIFPPASTRSEYLAGLAFAVRQAIDQWQAMVGTPVNLVVHARKELSHDEGIAVLSCLRNLNESTVRAWSFVRLTASDDVLLLDARDSAGTPPAGVFVRMASRRALLQISGRTEGRTSVGRIVASGPWNVRIQESSPESPPIDALCKNILALASMNWSTVTAEGPPVSIRYPSLVAELLGRFTEAGLDVDSLLGAAVMRRPWFI